MAKRVTINEGDIFEVPLDNNTKGYFQFIMLDLTQLNSEVIRVFRKQYPHDETIHLAEIVKDEVHFYAHVIIKFGVKMGLWKKIGNLPLKVPLQKYLPAYTFNPSTEKIVLDNLLVPTTVTII